MQSLAATLSFQGGSPSNSRVALPPLYRIALVALFLGLLGLDFSKGLAYSALAPVWATVPIFVGLVRAFLVCGILGSVFSGKGPVPRILLIFGAVGAMIGFLSIIAAQGWALLAVAGHAGRMGLPVVALVMAFGLARRPELLIYILVSLTFLGHGSYALGWPGPRPQLFENLVFGTIGLEASAASIFLTMVGILNLLAAVLVFVRKLAMSMLIYMVVWGLMTSLAYPWAYLEFSEEQLGWLRWSSEFLTRLPHALLPLALLRSVVSAKRDKGSPRRLDISTL